jgi:hypothetical protein
MLIKSLILTPALLVSAFAQVPVTVARDYSFPPIGLASSETAQVNIWNSTLASLAPNSTPPTCTGIVAFANASGAVGSTVPFSTTGSQIFSTELSFSKLASSGTRAEFVVTIQANSTVAALSHCSLVFSLETFDTSTGATHVFLGSPATSTPAPILIAGR